MEISPLVETLRGKLIVSVQAYPGEPLRHPETMAQMAQACEEGGAAAIRCQGLSDIAAIAVKAEGAASFMVGTTEYTVPLGGLINVEEELKKLEADLKYQEGFLQSVLKKLSNEKFVSKAPANVIEMERKKQADAESKIASLKESIAALR